MLLDAPVRMGQSKESPCLVLEILCSRRRNVGQISSLFYRKKKNPVVAVPSMNFIKERTKSRVKAFVPISQMDKVGLPLKKSTLVILFLNCLLLTWLLGTGDFFHRNMFDYRTAS